MLIDVAFSKIADEHFNVGDIITAKPGGSIWSDTELTENIGMATLEVSQETNDSLQADITAFKVDSMENPQSVVARA
jgi:hypothetical protein